MRYKVALIGPKEWSLASINYFLKDNLKDKYDVRIFDWEVPEEWGQALFWSDIFISEVSVYNLIKTDNLKSKGMFVWHHLAEIPGLKMSEGYEIRHFTTRIDVEKNFEKNFFSINERSIKSVEKFYGITPKLLPIGVDDSFWDKRDVRKISTIGHVSSNNDSQDYQAVKRYDMFEDICNESGLNGKKLNGKGYMCGSYIYDGVDAVVCTSIAEGLPTPFLECAASKIPFISTNVGIVPEYKSVKTFETVEEAVEILKELNSDEALLKKYVDDVYDEVMSNRQWKDVVEKYWVPAIESIVNG